MKAQQLIQRWMAILALPLGTPRVIAQDLPPVIVVDSSRISLELNIPAFRLDVRQDGRIVRSFTVAVGMRQYATPTGEFAISSIVWNPTWYPPPSGWARNETVTPPGPSNPMGRVKLAIGNAYYLHGTPAVSSLGKAASHGCVRMHNDDVIALASMIESEPGALRPGVMPTVPPRNWSISRTVTLLRPVPVRIAYHLAEVRNSELIVHADIYRRATDGVAAHVIDALRRASIDSNSISLEAVLQRIAATKARPIRIPLETVHPAAVEGELMQQPGTADGCSRMFPATG